MSISKNVALRKLPYPDIFSSIIAEKPWQIIKKVIALLKLRTEKAGGRESELQCRELFHGLFP